MIEEINRLYIQFPQPRTFEEDLAAYLEHGYVIERDGAFLMGRPIEREAPHELQVNPCHRFENPDTWLVWIAVGVSVNTFLTMVPFPLSWVAWSRRGGPLKFYSFHRLCAKLKLPS